MARLSVMRSKTGGAAYGATADAVQFHDVGTGLSTNSSMLRGIGMRTVNTAFALSGNGNSALSQSAINASLLGSGVQSVGGNLCNGTVC